MVGLRVGFPCAWPARYKLFQCCEWAKRALSLHTDFELEVPELHPTLGAVYKQTITRADFVAANKNDFDRTIGTRARVR